VADWLNSRHASMTAAAALGKPALERRVSAESVPDELSGVAVGCYECHALNPSAHQDNFEHFGFRINVVVSPLDCRVCHPLEVRQFTGSKKEQAIDNLKLNPVYHGLVKTATGLKELRGGALHLFDPSPTTENKTCFGCHGTAVTVAGTKTIDTELGELEVPRLTNWPNHGVGRRNPDGSLGACTACHPRHSFSIEIARKPYTCAQCHLHPDLPAWEVYSESKHGNIFFSKHASMEWNAVPWTVGKDMTAPTCATCHNSLLVNDEQKVIAERSHDFGSRLWVRIFGLITSHAQPRIGSTYTIRNADGLPLPTTFTGIPASPYLIDEETQLQRRKAMTSVCTGCHGTSFAKDFLAQLDTTNVETDRMVLEATKIMQKAWDGKMADPKNPFDERLEQKWVEQWLFYATSTRYGAAMGGPDYSTFKNGWWYMTKTLQELHETVNLKKK
jgi:hypothetical protein